MDKSHSPAGPDKPQQTVGLFRRQEDLRLQQFHQAFDGDMGIPWPDRPRYRVAPTLHSRHDSFCLAAGQRASDRLRGSMEVFVRVLVSSG